MRIEDAVARTLERYPVVTVQMIRRMTVASRWQIEDVLVRMIRQGTVRKWTPLNPRATACYFLERAAETANSPESVPLGGHAFRKQFAKNRIRGKFGD